MNASANDQGYIDLAADFPYHFFIDRFESAAAGFKIYKFVAKHFTRHGSSDSEVNFIGRYGVYAFLEAQYIVGSVLTVAPPCSAGQNFSCPLI